MFGFSLSKLLLTAVVIAAVWYGFRWFSRLDEKRRRELSGKGARRRRTMAAEDAEGAEGAEEMEKCHVCGTYVTADARACSRGDCPYPA